MTEAQIHKLCAEAQERGFESVSVNLTWFVLFGELLKNSSIKIFTFVWFTLVVTTTTLTAMDGEK